MTKNKTKKTIVVSLIAMLVCVAMLTGVTYAVFSKTVTSGSNVITVGAYDVTVKYDTAFNGSYDDDLHGATPFSAADKKPGDKIGPVYIKITNNNSYAVTATFTIPVLGTTNNTGLAPYLNAYIDGNASAAMDLDNATLTGTLSSLAGTSAHAILTNVNLAAGESRIVAIGLVVGAVPNDAGEVKASFDLDVVITQA